MIHESKASTEKDQSLCSSMNNRLREQLERLNANISRVGSRIEQIHPMEHPIDKRDGDKMVSGSERLVRSSFLSSLDEHIERLIQLNAQLENMLSHFEKIV